MQSHSSTPALLALFPTHEIPGLLVQVLRAFLLDDGQCICCEHAHSLLLPLGLSGSSSISVPAIIITVVVAVSPISVVAP